jgi:hypothetical protein
VGMNPKRLGALNEARFFANVDRNGPNGCWIWKGSRDKAGYGIYNGPNPAGERLVHRIVYDKLCEPIPEGLIVRHKCDNPSCCNPAHLAVGTHADNARDSIERGRKTINQSPMYANLSADIAKSMRDDYATGAYSFRKLAKRYGCSLGMAFQVVANRRWVDLEYIPPLIQNRETK